MIGRLSVAGCASTLLIAATAYVAGAPLSPKFSLLFGAAQFSILTTERFVLLGVLRLARRAGRNTRDILIVGSGPRALMITRTIQANPSWGLRVVGYLDSGDAPHSPGIPPEAMRKMVDVRAILRERVIDEVMIAVPRSMFGEVGPVVAACGEAGVPFTLLSDVFGDYLPPPVVTRFGPLASLRFAAVHHSATLIALKRGIDMLGGAFGLVVSIPVLLPAAIAIRLDSRGPIFFRQKRCGLYGRAFDLYKLRTMVVDAEDRKQDLLHLNEMSGPVFKIKNDPRVTRMAVLDVSPESHGNATGIGLAWVMPFTNAFSFFVGAVIIMLWTRLHKRSADNYNVPVASGLIAGESLMLAGLAIAATVVGLVIAGATP